MKILPRLSESFPFKSACVHNGIFKFLVKLIITKFSIINMAILPRISCMTENEF